MGWCKGSGISCGYLYRFGQGSWWCGVTVQLLPLLPQVSFFFFSLCLLRNLSSFLVMLLICSKHPPFALQHPTSHMQQPQSQLCYLETGQDFNNQPTKRGWYRVAACGCSCTCLHPQTRPCNPRLVPENNWVWNHRAEDTKPGLWSGLGWKSSVCPGEPHFVYDWVPLGCF